MFAKCLQFELNSVQQVADRNNDVQLVDFVESEFLAEQVCIAFMLAYFHRVLYFTVMAGQLNLGFSLFNCVLCRWNLSKRSQNMFLSWEGWAKDMVWNSLLNKVLPSPYLFMNFKCVFFHPFFELIYFFFELSGVWHFDQMLLRAEEAVA